MLFFWPFKKRKLGLVLSGGVARAMVHIGVLKVLEKHQIPIHYIVATSAGAVVGVAYAAGMSTDLIERIALRLEWARLVKITLAKTGPISSEALQNFIADHINKETFSELKIPFAALACDLRTGSDFIITRGSVARAVAASAAFPGVFTPVKWGNKLLVDGGVVNNFPVKAVKKLGAKIIVAVDAIPSPPFKNDPQDVFQVLGRSLDLILKSSTQDQRKAAHFLIEPRIPEDIWHLDLNRASELIKAGENAAARVVLKIKRRLGA